MSKIIYVTKAYNADATDFENNHKTESTEVEKTRPDYDSAFVELSYADFVAQVLDWSRTTYRTLKPSQYVLYSCVQTAYDKITINENEVTSGHYKTMGEKFTAAKNTVTQHDYSYPYSVEILAGEFWAKLADTGDKFEVHIAPDTVIGTVAADASAGATTVEVGSTVVDNMAQGWYVTINGTEYVCTGVDKAASTITISPALDAAASAGDVITRTIKMVENMYVYQGINVRMGWTKIGSSLIPANTTVRVLYTNVSTDTDKEIYFYSDILY